MAALICGRYVAYDDVGEGPAVLLVHGHPFDRSMWTPQAVALSEAGWRVIVPDLRGYGETPTAGDKTTLRRFSADLRQLLDHLGIRRAAVGGLSMGGQIVMQFLGDYPDFASAVILADTSARPDAPDVQQLRHQTADRLLREGMDSIAQELLPRMISPQHVESLPQVAEHVLRMMRGASPTGAAAALRGRAERPDYSEVLQAVTVATLVAVGSLDDYTPVEEAEHIRDLVSQAELVVFNDCGHLPNLEASESFNSHLIDFLRRRGEQPDHLVGATRQ